MSGGNKHMKLGTLLKLGALGIAATTAAAGSVLITTKALNKVSGGATVQPTPTPVNDKPAETPVENKVETPAPEIIPAKTPAEPVTLPLVEETPAPVEVQDIPEAPAPNAKPVAEETAPVTDYSDMPMNLPYLAGKLDEDEKDAADIVITPEEQKAEEAATPVTPVAIPVEPVAPITPVVPDAPEIVISSAEPIMEDLPTAEPLISQEPEKSAETFADLNPHEQGYAVGMSDIGGDELPPAETTSNFADFAEPEPAPVTFGDLTPEETVTVEEPTPAIVEPAVAESAPIEPIAPAEPAVTESAPVEPIAAAPVAEPVAHGSTVKIGDAVVSDKADDAAIKAVVDEFHVPVSNLVSITAEGNMPMVFEFLYSDMRTDATLMSVYFIMPDGKATLPPETDRENVLAFGRNFITGNEELRKFLA